MSKVSTKILSYSYKWHPRTFSQLWLLMTKLSLQLQFKKNPKKRNKRSNLRQLLLIENLKDLRKLRKDLKLQALLNNLLLEVEEGKEAEAVEAAVVEEVVSKGAIDLKEKDHKERDLRAIGQEVNTAEVKEDLKLKDVQDLREMKKVVKALKVMVA